MKRTVKKVAIIGSGIMGSGIACHFANIGVEVLLLDIAPRELTEAEIKTFCLQNGPAYQHPRWVVFLDALPLASTNKIDRIFLKNDAKNNLANRD